MEFFPPPPITLKADSQVNKIEAVGSPKEDSKRLCEKTIELENHPLKITKRSF